MAKYGALLDWNELKTSRAGQLYGLCLALVFFISALYWYHRDYATFLASSEAICWPMIPQCQLFRIVSVSFWKLFFVFLMGLSLANGYIFWKGRAVIAGMWLMALQLVLFLGVILMDFRTQLNQNQIIVYVVLGFLLLPNRMTSLLWVVISFYFWAGLLKTNADWLNGLSLGLRFAMLPSFFKTLATHSVVVLELFLVWGLLLKQRWIVIAVGLSLVAFHAFSAWIVGYYYPLLMLLVISIIFLRLRYSVYAIRPNLATQLFVGIMAALNLWSYQMPGDTAITGEGRIYSFHMFDATVDCQAQGVVKYHNGTTISRNLRLPVPTRLQCDPIFFLGRIHSLCDQLKLDPQFQDIDLKVMARRVSQTIFRPLIDESNVCQQPLTYFLFSSNEWIKK